MDEIVLRGMAKWPNVPAVYGWLTLTRRGQWLIRGDPVEHAALTAYIGRNYEHDAAGRWFFQNGPQRVFVQLEYTPMVYRASLAADGLLALETHVGSKPAALSGAWLDENGTLLIETDLGAGVIHDRDLEYLASAFIDATGNPPTDDTLDSLLERVQNGDASALWLDYHGSKLQVEPLQASEAPRQFGFDPCPTAPEGHFECEPNP